MMNLHYLNCIHGDLTVAELSTGWLDSSWTVLKVGQYFYIITCVQYYDEQYWVPQLLQYHVIREKLRNEYFVDRQ